MGELSFVLEAPARATSKPCRVAVNAWTGHIVTEGGQSPPGAAMADGARRSFTPRPATEAEAEAERKIVARPQLLIPR